jgi:hypothetical protein
MHDEIVSCVNDSLSDFGGSGTTSEITPKSSSTFGLPAIFVQQLAALSSPPLQQPQKSPSVSTSQLLHAVQTVLASQHAVIRAP